MEIKEFGFAIVGAGVIAHIHALAISKISHARLLAVCNINKVKADDFARQHACSSYGTISEMLTHPGVDIVCICTPSGIHEEPALQCIAAGKHCLIEKPLEVTLEKCDRIISAAQEAGIKIGVIFPSRFYEASKKIKQALQQNRFGDLVLGDAYVKWHRSPAYYASSPWRGTRALDGGGALMNQGIHSVDLLQWYMGPVATVQASVANIQHKGIEVEDTIVAVLSFANGALGTIEATTAVFPGALKQIEIMGTAGTAVLQESNLVKWDFLHPVAADEQTVASMAGQTASHGGVSNPADIGFLGHQLQIEDMIRAIQTDTTPMVDAVEGRKSVEIVLAVYESARTGKMIHL